MFFRMLKKDLRDKGGLNIILFIAISFASIISVFSAIMLWTNFVGTHRDLEKVNASDVTVIVSRNLDDVEDVEISEAIGLEHNAIEFMGFDEKSSGLFKNVRYFVENLSSKHNRVMDYDSRIFNLRYGEIAIPEYIHRYAKVNIGDRVRLTTQMGNVYEFRVKVITKDLGLNGIYRIIFNREDYEVIKNDSPINQDVYMIDLKKSCDIKEPMSLS